MHLKRILRTLTVTASIIVVVGGCSATETYSSSQETSQSDQPSGGEAARIANLEIPGGVSTLGRVDYNSSEKQLSIVGTDAAVKIDVSNPVAPTLDEGATLAKFDWFDGTELSDVFLTASREGLVPLAPSINKALHDLESTGSCLGAYDATLNPISQTIVATGLDGSDSCLNLFSAVDYLEKTEMPASLPDSDIPVEGIESDDETSDIYLFAGKNVARLDVTQPSYTFSSVVSDFITGMVKRPNVDEVVLSTYGGIQFLDSKSGVEVSEPTLFDQEFGKVIADSKGNVFVFSKTTEPIQILRPGSHTLENFAMFSDEDFPNGRDNLLVSVSDNGLLFASDGYNVHVLQYEP